MFFLLKHRFRTLIRPYYRGAAGILLVYDVTDPKTLDNVKDWLRSIEENISEYQVIQRILVGKGRYVLNWRVKNKSAVLNWTR